LATGRKRGWLAWAALLETGRSAGRSGSNDPAK
jgi:hypothetical protein